MTTKKPKTTRKKAAPEEVIHAYDEERLVTKHDKAVKAVKETVKVGRHLTVTRSSEGVKLAWDWPALLKEVQEATGDAVKKPVAKKPAARKKTAK